MASWVKIPAHHTLCAGGFHQVNVSARFTLPCIGKFGANVLDKGVDGGFNGGFDGGGFDRGVHKLGGHCLGEGAADQCQHRSPTTISLVGSGD